MEDHFTVIKKFFDKYKKISTPGPVPQNWLGFSHIHSKDYELYKIFDDTQLKKQSDHRSNNKVKLFCEIIVVIEEEWFDDMNLTDGATYLKALIKHAKNRFNQKIKFPREKK